MAKEKKNKKVNKLSLKECEDIIASMGGQLQCQYVQKILERQKELLVKKQFNGS
jgi:hypothetical protein